MNLRPIKIVTGIHALICMFRIAQIDLLTRFYDRDLVLAPQVRIQPQGLKRHGVGTEVDTDVVGRGDPDLAAAVELGA